MTDYTNSRCRLAPRTSSQQCVLGMQNGFMTTANGIFNRAITANSLNHSSLSITARDLGKPQMCSSNSEMAFNLHNAHQYHRDRSASGFLLVS